MNDEHECDETEDDHTFSLHLGFELQTLDDGRVGPAAVAIRSHMHNVPPMVVAETLVVVAHKILSDHMAHENFGHIEEHQIAHVMGSAAAQALLREVLQRAPGALHEQITVPDDISELLGD